MRPFLAAALIYATPVCADTGPAAPPKAELPQPVRDMVEAAARTGDKAKIDVVVAFAKQTNKGAEAEIDQIVTGIAEARAAAHQAKLAEAGYLDNWKGRGQLGASHATGNSELTSVTFGLNMQREGLDWRHRADAILDITDNRNGKDQQRILAGYQIDYKVSYRAYGWGRVEYERNREAGIRRRFAESAGVGWRAVQGGPFRWDLEVGPALRQTRFDTYAENSVAGRGASRFAWDLSGITRFTNDTALFVDDAASLSNTAALTSKMFGSVGTRLSYNLAWEEEPPTGLKRLDTTTRVTLVYDF